MLDKRRRNSGFLMTELIVGLSVFTILVVAFALSLDGFAKFNRYQLVRQQCIAAAQAQLDCIAATGKPIPDEDVERLWPKLSLSTKDSDGQGQWQGLKLVEVTATGKSFRNQVSVRLSRYVALAGALAKQE